MDWYTFCQLNFGLGIATIESLKIYVTKGKITAAQYEEITGEAYTA